MRQSNHVSFSTSISSAHFFSFICLHAFLPFLVCSKHSFACQLAFVLSCLRHVAWSFNRLFLLTCWCRDMRNTSLIVWVWESSQRRKFASFGHCEPVQKRQGRVSHTCAEEHGNWLKSFAQRRHFHRWQMRMTICADKNYYRTAHFSFVLGLI